MFLSRLNLSALRIIRVSLNYSRAYQINPQNNSERSHRVSEKTLHNSRLFERPLLSLWLKKLKVVQGFRVRVYWFFKLSVNKIHSLLDIPNGTMCNTVYFTDTVIPILIENIRWWSRRKMLKGWLIHRDITRPHNSSYLNISKENYLVTIVRAGRISWTRSLKFSLESSWSAVKCLRIQSELAKVCDRARGEVLHE
jgi:hypothetical protein